MSGEGCCMPPEQSPEDYFLLMGEMLCPHMAQRREKPTSTINTCTKPNTVALGTEFPHEFQRRKKHLNHGKSLWQPGIAMILLLSDMKVSIVLHG
jgi:hypothetical protein